MISIIMPDGEEKVAFMRLVIKEQLIFNGYTIPFCTYELAIVNKQMYEFIGKIYFGIDE